MTLVSNLRLVAADSAMLGNLARDSRSGDRARRDDVARFQQAMLGKGAVLFLSYHHLEELICHGNDDVVARRLDWLRALPTIAWIRPNVGGAGGLGSIMDLLIAELRAVAAAPAASAREVRDQACRHAIRFGTGVEALDLYEEIWPEIRAIAMDRAKRSSEIAAIVQGRIPNIRNRKLGDFLNGQLRTPAEVAHELAKSHAVLGTDIAQRGDRNIASPADLASEFMFRIIGEARHLDPASRQVVRDDLIRRGLAEHELDPKLRMGEIFDLLEFRQRIDVVAECLAMDLAPLRARAAMNRIPSWIVERALRAFRQSRARNPGSDLTDRHLACLGAYADLSLVDRRTHEDFLRARRGEPLIAAVLKRVEKSSSTASMIHALGYFT